MKYTRVISYVTQSLWAVTMEKLADIVSVLAFRASGSAFTPDEIQARIGSGGGSDDLAQSGAVAVIPIRGVIAHRMGSMDDSSGGTSTERIGKMLAQVASDPNIRAIVYDVDSPGGTVQGVQELAAQMFALRGLKRQVAQVNATACSAAYWLASQCDEIVSIPSGVTGSIGVYSAHQDMSAALEKEGVKVTLISAGKYKVAGNPFEPLSEDERAVTQARVDDAYGQFVKDVARGRGVTPAAVRGGYGEGRALEAKAAKAAGLIDRIATMDETLARLTSRSDRQPSIGMRGEGDAPVTEAEAGHSSPAAVSQDDTRRRRLRVL
jgi:signal peptide peptidase SppA